LNWGITYSARYTSIIDANRPDNSTSFSLAAMLFVRFVISSCLPD